MNIFLQSNPILSFKYMDNNLGLELPKCKLFGNYNSRPFETGQQTAIKLLNSTNYECVFGGKFEEDHEISCHVTSPFMPDQSSEVNRVHDASPSTTVWIVVGVCSGIFFVILVVIITISCRKNNQKSVKKLSKSNISYPNSLATSGDRVLRENVSVRSEPYNDQLQAVVSAPSQVESQLLLTDSDGSEDEISRLKREALERATYEDYSDDTDDDDYSSEDDPNTYDQSLDSKVVFIPKIKQQEILHSAENEIDFLRQMEKEHERRNKNLQESILI